MAAGYIECFRADGSEILGNLDGQAVLRTVNYKRTNAYKALSKIVGLLRKSYLRCYKVMVLILSGKNTLNKKVSKANHVLCLSDTQ